MTNYLVIYEKDKDGFNAYVPSLSGCRTVGADMSEIETKVTEAIKHQLEIMGESQEFNVTLSLDKIPARNMSRVVSKHNLGEEPNDADYWVTQSPSARIAALETLRNQNIDQNGLRTRLQRVYRVIK
tara:strand:- start:939 stop:1319 length:381 start_codon:yes stop_codon:yes gene_type:complete